jgi:hypothetical protein
MLGKAETIPAMTISIILIAVTLAACGTPEPVIERIETTIEVTRVVPETVEVTVTRIVEQTVEVPVTQFVQQTEEIPVTRAVQQTVEVPVTRVVRQTVEVPVTRIVRQTVEVPVTRIIRQPATPTPRPTAVADNYCYAHCRSDQE